LLETEAGLLESLEGSGGQSAGMCRANLAHSIVSFLARGQGWPQILALAEVATTIRFAELAQKPEYPLCRT
jgi:hypothetical protein